MRSALTPRLPLALLVLAAIALPAAPLGAQGTLYTLDPDSVFLSGCAGPSPCACPVLMLGPLAGSFRLVPLLPQLGPIFEYAVADFAASVTTGTGATMVIAGSGSYFVDLASNTQSLTLDVTVDGAPALFDTIGWVELIAPFPAAIQVNAFSVVLFPCLYDGLAILASPVVTGVEFIRGDTNDDGALDISDAVNALAVLFPAPTAPQLGCIDAADANDDGAFNIADPIAVLANLFGGGSPLPPPFPGCGADPSADSLDCAGYAPCP